jgi:CHAT domain-containing protein
VTALRAGLDVQELADPKGAPNFDRKTAYKLYQELIQPLETLFKDKRVLFTATSGALQSLPLAVLVTAPPQGDDGDPAALAGTAWMIDRYALVTLPAVSSLRTLRCFAVRDPAERSPGCPPERHTETTKPAPKGTLAFAGVGAPVLGPPERTLRGGGYSAYMRGEVADPAALRTLPSLPGTAKELTAVAAHFGGGAVLLLDKNATETKVKTDPDVARARILEFATHALVADETERVGEPGLVLTPPQTPTMEDDGLLTASEAAQLHLSAEFVVLSACNTARRDGKLGADGLSGLARAFFYAGARAMLVSHWAISDAATPVLMNGFFTTLEKDRKDGRALAFRHAIKDMKADSQWAAPRYWAAFILVGDTDETATP